MLFQVERSPTEINTPRYWITEKLLPIHRGGVYAPGMCVTVSMLASGSKGNCAFVASSRTKILVDAGISCRETFKRMKVLGEDPQALAAISIKIAMPRILRLFGYRTVLISNTLIIGVMILLFTTIKAGTPVWLIVLQVFGYGFFTSLQYTSMNTLVYADVSEAESSSASSIASTAHQMSMSFGVATASLMTAYRRLLTASRILQPGRVASVSTVDGVASE